METLEHQHFIFHAKVHRENIDKTSKEILEKFLHDLVAEIDMEVLIPPQLAFSEFDAWTGMIGIVTSHITFHYWTQENYLQLDIYSCKRFCTEKTTNFLRSFWKTKNEYIQNLERNPGGEFIIQKLH